MAARKAAAAAAAEGPASDDSEEGDAEEEEEEEEDAGFLEYDSTWEDEGGEEDGEPREEEEEEEEDRGRKGLPAAPAPKEKPKAHEKQGRWSPSATWASGNQERRKANRSSMGFRRCKNANSRNWGAARDMQKYRRHYPGLEEAEVSEQDMWNLNFYKNEIHFKPHGLHIEDLLEKWQKDYGTLEENHSYIQWLFPLREPGMNWRAKILTCQEIEAFKKSKEVMERFVRAYKLMLGFYGIDLINEETGELKRAENWCDRFENLNRYSHNNLRITRILKCLGEMGYEHYQVHLVKFFLTETLVQLELPRVLRSALDYFMFTVRSKQKRRELVHFAWQHFKPKHGFVWGPRKKLRRFQLQLPEILSHQEPKEEQETAGEEVPQGTVKDDAGTPNDISQEEPSRDDPVAGVEKDLPDPLNERVAGRPRSASPIGQPASPASVESTFPPTDSTVNPSGEKEPASPLEGDGSQGGDAVESQARLASVHPAPSEGKDVSPLASPAARKEEKRGDRVDPPAAPLGEENGNSSEGESLKEAKKRKFEMGRLSGERAEALQGPTDIEKISFNLEEVAIEPKDAGKCPPLEEQAQPPALEEGNGDSRDVKEAESVSAVIKRRKVEEMEPLEDVLKRPARVDSEVVPLEGRLTNRSASRLQTTEELCRDGLQIVTDRCADTLTRSRTEGVDLLVNSPTRRPELGRSLDDPQPGKRDEPETTSAVENKAPPSPETPPARKKEVERDSGQEEGGVERKKEAETEKNTTTQAGKSISTAGGPEEE